MANNWIGVSSPRLEGHEKVTGASIYVDDLRLPNMLVGRILRSPHPHARIVNIDVKDALKIPGVHTVVTGQDMPKKYGLIVPDQTILAVDVVRFVGDEVAAVSAESEDAAALALEAIRVEYEPMPGIFDPEGAMDEGALLLHSDHPKNIVREHHINHGDVEAAFAQADCIVEKQFKPSMQNHCYLEPYGCVVSPEGGRLTVWTPAQAPFSAARELAKVFELPVTQVRVIETTIGGSYGGKGHTLPLMYITALLARKSGRPVSIVYKRWEEFVAGRPRIPLIANIKMGFKKNGKILAKKTRIVADNGAYACLGPGVFVAITMRHDNQYRIPNLHTDSYLVYTNKTPTGPMRGFGNSSMEFALESLIDIAAKKLGIDPIEMRLRNVTRAGDITIHGWKIQTDGLTRCLEAVREKMEPSRREQKPGHGFGFACAIHASGNREQFWDGDVERLRLNHDGTLHLMNGDPDGGQGSSTTLAQIAATELEIPLERIRVAPVDTDMSPFGLGFYGDRITTIGGHAVLGAAKKMKKAILEAAALLLEVDETDLIYRDGSVYVREQEERSLNLAEIASRLLWKVGGRTITTEFVYDPLNTKMKDDLTFVGNTHPTHTFSAQGVEVSVDAITGEITLLRVVSAHDLGRAINPQSAEGQVEGGVVTGIGYGLYESHQFSEGKPLVTDFEGHGIPRAPDLPQIDVVLVETNDPMGPFGAKGVGQTGTLLPAPAIANAVADAIGVRLTEIPMRPEKVLDAIQKMQSPD